MEEQVKKYNPFVALVLSFYSKKLYIQAAMHWRKRIFVYLLLLLVLIWIPFSVRYLMNVNHMLSNMARLIAPHVPAVTIKSGVAQTEKPGDYRIPYPGMPHSVLLVVNTSKNALKESDFMKSGAMFLLGHDALYMRTHTKEPKVYPYNHTMHLSLTPENFSTVAESYLHVLDSVLLIFLWTLGLIMAYLIYLIYAAIISVCASIFVSLFDYSMPSMAVFRLTLILSSPPMIVLAFLYGFGLLSYGVFFALLIIQLVYLFLGAYLCKRPFKKLGETS